VYKRVCVDFYVEEGDKRGDGRGEEACEGQLSQRHEEENGGSASLLNSLCLSLSVSLSLSL